MGAMPNEHRFIILEHDAHAHRHSFLADAEVAQPDEPVLDKNCTMMLTSVPIDNIATPSS